ncbi:DUF2281 domain-containing protein [Runella sp.]|uniref:DUF2281 domain-containing protein n=1 Tax=Runella sp. TaxID=1960881 RepID=UPI003D0B3E30
MLTAVRGIYENEQVILDEPLPTQHAKVIVTIIEEKAILKKRPLGTMKGTIWMSDDFNEPLDDLKEYM